MKIIFKRIFTFSAALFLGFFAVNGLFFAQGAIAAPAVAKAMIQGTSESGDVTGEAWFRETASGLEIRAVLDNAPDGKHGFHIHEFGSCAKRGTAAGGHYNPDGVKHGYLPKDGFQNAHAGDLGNIEVNQKGEATYEVTVPGLALSSGAYAIAGRALIIHADEDDFGQPVGNAGDRIGCGIIVISNPDAV